MFRIDVQSAKTELAKVVTETSSIYIGESLSRLNLFDAVIVAQRGRCGHPDQSEMSIELAWLVRRGVARDVTRVQSGARGYAHQSRWAERKRCTPWMPLDRIRPLNDALVPLVSRENDEPAGLKPHKSSLAMETWMRCCRNGLSETTNNKWRAAAGSWNLRGCKNI